VTIEVLKKKQSEGRELLEQMNLKLMLTEALLHKLYWLSGIPRTTMESLVDWRSKEIWADEVYRGELIEGASKLRREARTPTA
jgi:hypothetical protein